MHEQAASDAATAALPVMDNACEQQASVERRVADPNAEVTRVCV
jgi:hypothetical protein